MQSSSVRARAIALAGSAALLAGIGACEALLDAGSLTQTTEHEAGSSDAAQQRDSRSSDSGQSRGEAGSHDVGADEVMDAKADAMMDAGAAGDTGKPRDASSGSHDAQHDTGPSCYPHPLPGNFTPGSGLNGKHNCDSNTLGRVAACFTSQGDSDPICNDPTAPVVDAASNVQECISECLFTGVAAPEGPFIVLSPPGSSGSVELPVAELGACVGRFDSGAACAIAIEARVQCEVQACLQYCPVTSLADQSGIDALLGTAPADGGPGCLANADVSVCSSYATMARQSCSDGGPYETCSGLLQAATSTPQAEPLERYLGFVCGGLDAGIMF